MCACVYIYIQMYLYSVRKKTEMQKNCEESSCNENVAEKDFCYELYVTENVCRKI